MEKNLDSLLDFTGQKSHGGKLDVIASDMIGFARKHPYHDGADRKKYARTLQRGLVVCYIIDQESVSLGLCRLDVYPSETEEQIISKAFHVPGNAFRRARIKGQYHHVVYNWPVVPAYQTIAYPGDARWLAVPAGQWRREGDKIIVEYQDKDQLFWSVTASLVAKEVDESEMEQISMFGTQDTSYREY